MTFTDAQEVRKYLGGIFETAFADPEIGPKLKATGLVVAFDYTEPEALITLDAANESVVLGTIDGTEPSATMSMKVDTANRYWQGKVSLPLAMAKGQIKVGGNVAGLIKLAPLGKKLYPMYVGMLEGDGRSDLVVSS
jgi:hypothetical protein